MTPIAADLFYEITVICEDKQNVEASAHVKMLCLHLYLNAIPKEKQFQTRYYLGRIRMLIKDLEGKSLSKSR